MKIVFFLGFLFYSSLSFSCQKLEGQIKINNINIQIEHKCLQNQTYSITNDSYFVHLKLNGKILQVNIDQAKKNQLTKILSTELMFQENKELEFLVKSNQNDVKINLNLNHI